MLYNCALSKNYHERRLASEGLRPSLPWAKKLTLDYHKPLIHLNRLFYDSTRYVTRSVANHLNDISKIDSSLVIKTLKEWRASKKQNVAEMEYITTHALRTLVKEGNQDALALLGYTDNPKIEIDNFHLHNHHVKIGESLLFEFNIKAYEDVKLMVDYCIYFNTKKGTFSPKIHKLKKINLLKGESVLLQKRHLFKANMTTRKLYSGKHKVTLQINGKHYKHYIFTLE
jgi:3-methyladenine DNA glycosylase AlkC